ncbi:MAG: class I SAM-dependent methyltransferase [Bacteroidaceae bacterium]|nr:class I SAM-dependent methyltransferase [Bacteroidaceae bacterium]
MEEYILHHIDPEGEYLNSLYRATHLQLLYPHMVSGHLQGRILKMLTQMIRPQRVLEIGTYSGYSALCMAEGLPTDGKIYTIEINDEQEEFTRPWFDNSPYAQQIEFIIGDAMQVVPQLGITFDMAFVDGDKRRYLDFYELVLAHLRPGGYMLVDNTLWGGHVVEEHVRTSDLQTWGIKHFNDFVAADARVEKVILPLRDGLTIIRKKDAEQ